MLNIRGGTIQDLSKLYALECETYGAHHWSKNSFTSELTNEFSRYFVCEMDSEKKILGYAGYWIIGNEGHITTMVVSPKCRRKHIADILLYSIIKSAIYNRVQWLTLEVRVSNIAAIRLYNKYKFRQLGIRKNYYQDNSEDALILWTDDITKPEYATFLLSKYQVVKAKFETTDILQYPEIRNSA